MSINVTTLVGRLVKDMDLKYTGQGTPVGTFTLAVNKPFTNKEGNREADFINCVIWRKSAELMANMAKKGSLVGITGRIQTRNYENQQGQRVYVTEVVADSFQMLESRQNNGQQGTFNQPKGNYPQNNKNVTEAQRDPFEGNGRTFNDDDLPF